MACHHPNRLTTGLEGTLIPAFDLMLPDSATHFNTRQLPGGQPTVFLYFSPYCPYCLAQVQDLIDNNLDTSKIRFVLVTAFPYSDMKAFYDKLNLARYRNLIVGTDSKNFFGDYFKTSQVPYLALYDGKGKLQQVNLGKMYLSEIRTIAFE